MIQLEQIALKIKSTLLLSGMGISEIHRRFITGEIGLRESVLMLSPESIFKQYDFTPETDGIEGMFSNEDLARLGV